MRGVDSWEGKEKIRNRFSAHFFAFRLRFAEYKHRVKVLESEKKELEQELEVQSNLFSSMFCCK